MPSSQHSILKLSLILRSRGNLAPDRHHLGQVGRETLSFIFFLTHECRHKKKGKCISYYYMYSMQYMQYIMNHGYTLSIRHEHTTWYQYIHMYLCRWHLSTGCHFSFFYVGPLKNDNILENSKFLTKSIDVLNAKKYLDSV